MTPTISKEQIETFNEDGAVCLRGVISDHWVEVLREATQDVLDRPSTMAIEYEDADAPGRFLGDQFVWTERKGFRDFIFDSPAAGIAAQLMGAHKINFFYDHLLVKEPGAQSPTPWHQDAPYWKVKGWQVCSLWIALDPVDDANGAVKYVKGSHKWGKLYQPQSFTGDDRYKAAGLEPCPDIDATVPVADVLSWSIEPGDCLAHHSHVIHGAGPNTTSDRRRRGYATRWTGDDVVYDPRPGTADILRDPGIESGAAMDCDLFPVVWQE
jgi:ectoine hydroxylase-related dioxygenase (phytanoyl-CoA dioxygenase family)